MLLWRPGHLIIMVCCSGWKVVRLDADGSIKKTLSRHVDKGLALERLEEMRAKGRKHLAIRMVHCR